MGEILIKENKSGTSHDSPSFLFPINKIIHLKISEERYLDFIISFNFSYLRCPVCGSLVKYHGTYEKKLYNQTISIHQVMCQNKNCKKTHAIIPSFSVPGCSIGTKELELFLKARSEGKIIGEAGQCFIDRGMSADYPESIHKRLNKYFPRIQLIFSDFIPSCHTYIEAIRIITKGTYSIFMISELCKKRLFNPVLFSRTNILVFPKFKVATPISYNPNFEEPP